MLEMTKAGSSAMQAACAWIRDGNNTDTWQSWKPDDGTLSSAPDWSVAHGMPESSFLGLVPPTH
jgi:hypothetical protein